MMASKRNILNIISILLIIILIIIIIYQRHERQKYLQTALYYLIYKKHDVIAIKELINQGVDLDGSLPQYSSPPIIAAAGQNYDITKLLLENGANVQVISKNLKTPMYYAVGDINLVKLLYSYGAKLNDKKSPDSETAFESAAVGGYLKTIEFFVNHYDISPKAYNNAIVLAAESEYPENVSIIKYLIKNAPCNITKGVNKGILEAKTVGNSDIVKILEESL